MKANLLTSKIPQFGVLNLCQNIMNVFNKHSCIAQGEIGQ